MTAISDPTEPSACASESSAQPAVVLALIGVGLAIGVWMRGHFPVPYLDFMDFVDPGHDLWQGRLPYSLRRAPFYPLLVTALGQLASGEAPERSAAGWLNALLLPANAVLIYWIGSRWIGQSARWAALTFMLTPLSFFLTGHEIVEPLVTFLTLATVRAAQWRDEPASRPNWRFRNALPYALAALGAVTRYDIAGLIGGLVLTDALRGQRLKRVALSGAIALLPLAAWLLLTWLTWEQLGEDHYVQLFAKRSADEMIRSLPHDFAWSLWVVQASIFDGPALRMGFWLQPLSQPLLVAIGAAMSCLALLGAGVLARNRASAFWVGFVVLMAYAFVHALFPFRLERFGYPMSPLLLLAIWAGWQFLQARIPAALGDALRRFALPPVAILLAAAVVGEISGLTIRHDREQVDVGALLLAFVVAACAASVFAAPAGKRVARGALLLGVALLLLLQARASAPLLNSGFERINLIHAARWIRQSVPPEDGVLSISSALFRLYVGRTPRDRFVEFPDLKANDWHDILAECRQRGIRWIVWHDQMDEYFGEMLDRWRIQRFSGLGQPEPPAGLELARFFADRPNLWIYRLKTDSTSAPAAGF